jgi:predicted transcriptional regulator
LELFFATIAFFVITIVASYIYYIRISEAQLEYERAKDIVRGITKGFSKQIARLTNSISIFEESASQAREIAAQALDVSMTALENSKSGVDKRRILEEKILETEKSLEQMRKDFQEISKRPITVISTPSMDTPIPLQQRDVLDQLTPTEIDVLILIDEMGEGSVPEIREKIQKTREHTARLLKKLFDRGFIDRNTRSMPYRYHLRKEIVELVQNQKAKNEINL